MFSDATKRAEAVRAFALGVAALLMLCHSARGDAGPMLGLQAVDEPLPWFDDQRRYPEYSREARDLVPDATVAVTSRGRPAMDEPVSLRLSRYRYPAEDAHLDALVRFDLELGEQPDGRLVIELRDAQGERLSRDSVSTIPGSQLHFSYRFPESLAGHSGTLHITWQRDGGTATAAQAFEIAAPADPPRSGRVRLSVPNDTGATAVSVPMTVGVPFPHGALASTDHLRLVDEYDREIPLQATKTARWSRFGSVKWVRCDFALDLDGESRDLFLEFGPDVSRAERAPMRAEPGDAFPALDAGRVRIDDAGLAFDAEGNGAFTVVLDRDALTGAFVTNTHGASYVGWGHRWMRGTGMRFGMNADAEFEVEHVGPEQIVLRTADWYTEPETGDPFCKYVVRYVIHRDSPLVRIVHTWVYTGDGNRDPIRNMGWRFGLTGLEPTGFLSSFEDGDWLEGYYLRQEDHDRYTLFDYQAPRGSPPSEDHTPARPIAERDTGERAPGVMAAAGQGVRLYVGVQDFWQNFPSSLMIEDDALTFYQWPRYGRPRQHSMRGDDISEAWRLWFVHEGETLNFRVPTEAAEAPIYVTESGVEPQFTHGRPDAINAQGVAKTAEMWLYLTDDDAPSDDAVRTLRGLQERTLQPIVDPQWMTRSGAFHEVAAADFETYAEIEQAYRANVRSPLHQVERMGIYGKWHWGDLLRTADLDTGEGGLYRTFRGRSWGWPYSWMQFARIGEPEMFRFAQAATRMMADVYFCHYVSDDVAAQFAQLPEHRIWAKTQPFRGVGWHNRKFPFVGGFWGPTTRSISDQIDYLLDAWRIAGEHRALDVVMAWAKQTKIEEPDKKMRDAITAGWNRGRWPANLQKQYLDMYEQTWDPWFLAAAQAIAEMHVWRYRDEQWTGHFWRAGHVTWQRYSGSPEHEAFLMHHIESESDWQHLGWASPVTIIPAVVAGYHLTGDDYYLRRAAGLADLLQWGVYTADEPSYYEGFHLRHESNSHMLFTSWMQKWFPLVMGAFARAGGAPEHPLPVAFDQRVGTDDHIAVRKRAGEPLVLRTQGAFVIEGPNGQTYQEGDEAEVTLPADAPPGVYRVAFPSPRSVRLPITPPDTPEVVVPGSKGRIDWGANFAQHWFLVPEGIESFWIEFENTGYLRQVIRQVVIWDADGREVWAHRERAIDHAPDEQPMIRAEVTVAPDQAGRLWRVTLPGQRSMPMRLDPQLPRALAHDAQRWFAPDASP